MPISSAPTSHAQRQPSTASTATSTGCSGTRSVRTTPSVYGRFLRSFFLHSFHTLTKALFVSWETMDWRCLSFQTWFHPVRSFSQPMSASFSNRLSPLVRFSFISHVKERSLPRWRGATDFRRFTLLLSEEWNHFSKSA